MIGQTISHYKILAKLGEGGMGVVYQAHDVKLDRPVALKFLPGHFLGNEEVRKRFEREAKAAAALQHPNICPVFEIDEFEGKSFIAMALIEGQSLDKKIAQGPLKLDEALTIAQQIAQGLEAAHKKGIIHRDVKPENVMVGEDNHVTIMDFGLALLTEASRLTRADETMGTVAYMSPEQTQGTGTNHRTDIWSLGVVLYEMITGQQPFKGDYDKAVMYSILNEDHEPITGIRAGMPMELERVVAKCLEKRAEDRYQAVADLIVDIRNSTSGSRAAKTQVHAAPRAHAPPSRQWQAVAVLAVVAAAWVSWIHFTEPEPERPVRRFSYAPPDFYSLEDRPAISPDGKLIAYTAGSPKSELWLQSLDQVSPRQIESTGGALRPFWSPDSQWIGYIANRSLRRIPAKGGLSTEICRLSGDSYYFLATWSPDGESIIFCTGNPARLFQVPAGGGDPKPLQDVNNFQGDSFAFSPQWVSAQTLLYRLGSPNQGSSLVARNLETAEEMQWSLSAGGFVFSPTGHILSHPRADSYGDLSARPFRIRPLGPSGNPFAVARNAAFPSISRDGTLVYKHWPGAQAYRVRFVDRSGAEIRSTPGEWQLASQVAFSPTGNRILASLGEKDERGMWLYDLDAGIWTLLTSISTEGIPIFDPAGDRFFFAGSTTLGGNLQIMTQSIEPGESRRLIEGPVTQVPLDVNRVSGAILYYQVERDERLRDLWYLEPDGDGGYTPRAFVSAPLNQIAGTFSPDGEWVAYVSDQEGRNEVYLRKFPEGAPMKKVSRQGGGKPRWRGDGRELIFIEGQTLMAVDIQIGANMMIGTPEALFSEPSFAYEPIHRRYDVAPDGKSFAVISYSADSLASPPVIQVVEHWYEEFRDRERD